jgi:hypothetical protein
MPFDMTENRRWHSAAYFAQMNIGCRRTHGELTPKVGRLLSRRRKKMPYSAQVSLGMTLDATLEDIRQALRRHQKTPRRSSGCRWTRSWITDAEHRDPIAATPPQDAIFGTHEPRDAIGHDVGKPTPSVAVPITRRLQKTPHLPQMSFRMPLETTLENRSWVSRRQSTRKKDAMTRRWALGWHSTWRWRTDSGCHDAPKRRHILRRWVYGYLLTLENQRRRKTPYLAHVRLGMSLDRTLENRLQASRRRIRSVNESSRRLGTLWDKQTNAERHDA